MPWQPNSSPIPSLSGPIIVVSQVSSSHSAATGAQRGSMSSPNKVSATIRLVSMYAPPATLSRTARSDLLAQ